MKKIFEKLREVFEDIFGVFEFVAYVFGLVWEKITTTANVDTKRPYDYPCTKWVCKEHGAHFIVDENGKISEAKICMGGEDVDFLQSWCIFDNTGTMRLERNGKVYELEEYCRFQKKRCTVIISDTKGCFQSEGVKMEFLREKL